MSLPSVGKRAAMLAWRNPPSETGAGEAGRPGRGSVRSDQPPTRPRWTAMAAADSPAAQIAAARRRSHARALAGRGGASSGAARRQALTRGDPGGANREGDRVELPLPPGQFVRPAGAHRRRGCLTRGCEVDAWRLSGAGGRGELAVARRPRVSFHGERSSIRRTPGPYQIRRRHGGAGGAGWGGGQMRLAGDDICRDRRARAADCESLRWAAPVGEHDLRGSAQLGLSWRRRTSTWPGKSTWPPGGWARAGLPGNPRPRWFADCSCIRSAAMLGGDPLSLIQARAGAPFPPMARASTDAGQNIGADGCQR